MTFDFTSHGLRAFQLLTRTIAERVRKASRIGQPNFQHFAIVLDDRLISVPSIDYEQYPNGITASDGSEISGGFTLTSARTLAVLLQSGPLATELVPVPPAGLRAP